MLAGLQKTLVFGLASWEAVALASEAAGRPTVPTVSAVVGRLTPRRRAVLTAGMVGWLVWHFHADDLLQLMGPRGRVVP